MSNVIKLADTGRHTTVKEAADFLARNYEFMERVIILYRTKEEGLDMVTSQMSHGDVVFDLELLKAMILTTDKYETP